MNYPDDIRQYDDHPDSPFYEGGGRCYDCEELELECVCE